MAGYYRSSLHIMEGTSKKLELMPGWKETMALI